MDAELINKIANATNAVGEMSDKLGAYIGAGIAMLGGLGTGIGQGFAAGKASEAGNPEAESKIRTMMIVGCAIAETAAIYALIIAILLIFVA